MRHFSGPAGGIRRGFAFAALTLVTVGCGNSDPEGTAARRATTTAAPAATSTAPATTATTATTTGPNGSSPTTFNTSGSSPATNPGTGPPSSLGPEWLQRDGRVLIEAVASGDPQQLLADLVALGLTDGVVAGRLVNGWLPVDAFQAAQRLETLQFVQPTGAGTG